MTNPNERYRELIQEQITLRRENRATIDVDEVKRILRDRQTEFDGHLVVLVANDFGKPIAFLPEEAGDYSTVLNSILDEIHDQKWDAENFDLRDVRNQLMEEVAGLHKVLPALYFGEEAAEYDITAGKDLSYNFVTIRQVAGLVDWLANAQKIAERY